MNQILNLIGIRTELSNLRNSDSSELHLKTRILKKFTLGIESDF